MYKSIKKKWTKALKSKKYLQGTGCLKDDQGRYCCLGVLSDLYLKAHNRRWKRVSHPKNAYDQFEIDGQTATLPLSVCLWAGLPLDEETGYQDPVVGICSVPNTSESTTLADLNDNEETFETIAAIIEEKF